MLDKGLLILYNSILYHNGVFHLFHAFLSA
nr:MAG TPA: hypothetical protein [Caudoviricetes sp.]